MPQKLSAMNYIKNNKRRISVLIVSLGLCFVLTYLTGFLLSSTEETFRPILTENTKKMQYVSLAGSTLGIDAEGMSDEEFYTLYEQKNIELLEMLKQQEKVKEVYFAQVIYCEVAPAVGVFTFEMPLVKKQEIPAILSHMDAELCEGRLPEKEGEILLDKASMANNDYELNGYFNEDSYGEYFKIVGVLECDRYFGCGIPAKDWSAGYWITILSEGIDDVSMVLHDLGIDVRENYDTVIDLKLGEKMLKEEVIDVIGNSTTFIYVGIIILLSISLLVVYTTYLRDRYNEWCLYCSIGYSRKTIYAAVIRELLFTFATALVSGGILIAISVVILNAVMIEPEGLRCRFFQLKTLGEILCTYAFLLGILQIPVRYALHKICTIDAIDDDLY